MKNIFIIAIVLCITICFLTGCARKNGEPNPTPHMIYYDFIDRPYWEFWPDKGKEINVKLDIHSEFTDDAYLAVYTFGKEFRSQITYQTISLVTSEITTDSIVCRSYLETFRDSLKIDGFHIRAYRQYLNSDSLYIFGFSPECNRFVEFPFETPFDYPVYFKKIRVKKGKNKESFKIVLPRELVSIPGEIRVLVGIGRWNDEIKSRFEENFPGDYELTEYDKANQNLYFETFPDSSKTSFVFSTFRMRDISFFPDDSQKFRGKHYFFYHWISLGAYDALDLQKNEFTYK